MTEERTIVPGAPSSARPPRAYSTLWPVRPVELYALADLGMTIDQIARYFGVAVSAVTGEVAQLGLPVKHPAGRLHQAYRPRRRYGAGRPLPDVSFRGIC